MKRAGIRQLLYAAAISCGLAQGAAAQVAEAFGVYVIEVAMQTNGAPALIILSDAPGGACPTPDAYVQPDQTFVLELAVSALVHGRPINISLEPDPRYGGLCVVLRLALL